VALQSCGIFNGGRRTPPPPPPANTGENPDKDPDATDMSDVTDTPDIDTIDRDLPILKDIVNIGVMLPFKLDDLDATRSFTGASKNSFQLYKGIRLAIQDLNIRDVDVKIHVLDNKGLASRSENMLKKEPFPEMDLVIGPLYTKNIQAVGDFAKAEEIPFISPLSSAANLASSNPYIYSAVATKKTRYSLLLDYLKKEYPNANIGVMFQPNGKEVAAKNELRALASGKGLIMKEQISEGATMFSSVSDMLQKGKENVVIVPADDNEEGQMYVSRLLSYLEFEAANYDITVVGLEEWNSYTSIASSKFSNVNTLVLDRYFVDPYNSLATNKMSQLTSRNNGKPLTIYMLQGYDIMSYVGDLIENHGIEFMDHFGEEQHMGVQTRFAFGEYENKFNENKFINLVRYNNGA